MSHLMTAAYLGRDKSFLLKCWKGLIIKTEHGYVYSPALSPFSVIELGKAPTLKKKTEQQLCSMSLLAPGFHESAFDLSYLGVLIH